MTADEEDHGYLEGSAVLLVDREGRVLLQQRDDNVPPAGAGRWAIPGGRAEGDEDPLATALREFEEETGARLEQLRHFGTYAPWRDAWMKRFVLHLFVAQDDVPREAVQVLEGVDFQYYDPGDAVALPLNPVTQRFLYEVLGSPVYRAACRREATGERWTGVLEIDRWGRVLVVRPGPGGRPGEWDIPGGVVSAVESPDRAGLRVFDSWTGHVLESMNLFRVYTREAGLPLAPARWNHFYHFDEDVQVEDLGLPAGVEAAYVGPSDVEEWPLAGYARVVLEDFFVSPAYKAMFH